MILVKFIFFFVIFQIYIHNTISATFETCQNVHGRNLEELSGSWPAYHRINNVSETYLIDICSGLTHPTDCIGSSVCLNVSGRWFSLGNHSVAPTIQSANSTSISFYLEYNTTRVCEIVENRKRFYRSSITFECGRTLGSPLVISLSNCSVDFLWETSRACLPHVTDARKEVRCYAFDSVGKKRDLEYLIKQSGGYYVKDPSSTQSGEDGVYINVCRDIQVNSLHDCPSDAAACLVQNGHSYMLGALTTGVNITDDRLVLEYLAPNGSLIPPSCAGFTPRVLVTFVCPGIGRGGSKPPIITSSMNCQYNIEWWTEAACAIDAISSTSCGLNAESHGIDLDLRPLSKPSGQQSYVVNTSSSDSKFYLNVCSKSGFECGENGENENNAVCQISNAHPKGYIAGNFHYAKVKYYDGQLSLTYEKGERCHSNGYRRTSVILFHCNKSAGVGYPTFNHELHCNYYFDWETSYACVSTPTCHMTDDAGQTYDLSTLTRAAGFGASNWRVLHSQDKGKSYFLNVCGDLLSEEQTNSCPSGSSVCFVNGENVASFGSFSTSTLTRNANKLMLTYEGGGSCSGGKQKSTTIIFYCKMGDLESSPVLKYLSSDGCHLVLTWHTAAACPLKSVNGTNCMVSDEESGLTFDLQRLSRPTNDSYKLTVGSYDYYINVCDDVNNSPCSSTGRHAGACQVEQNGENRKYVLGETSNKLLYYNGFVKLLYTNGDAYRDHRNRSVQISFLCDSKKGAGKPEFVKEAKHTYVFNWYTAYVCPFASTQCMVTGSDGTQYDLSSLSKSEDDQDANWSVLGEKVAGMGKRKYYLNVCRPVNEVQASKNRDIGCDGLAAACETLITPSGEEAISVSSLGRPTAGPAIETGGRLVLKYSNGDNCTENGQTKQFQTHIYFSCHKGALSSSPRFLERTPCLASFEWATEAACAINTNKGIETDMQCEVKSRNSQYIFNLEPLKRDSNQPYIVSGEAGVSYELNVCGIVDDCKKSGDTKNFAGCKKNGKPSTVSDKLRNHTAPSFSDDGRLSITYETADRAADGHFRSYEIDFVCNRSIAKGKPAFSGVDGLRTRFEFQTSLACEPQSVDCLVADNFGNQYDLTPLSTYDRPWKVIDIDRSRQFYLSVCRPLPPVPGCKGGASGACFFEGVRNHINGTNLGLVRSNPQAVSNGGQSSAVTIVYMGGDQCHSDPARRYSTRITFQCTNVEGLSPVVQPSNPDPCEFYFIWQTPAACPIKKSVSEPGQSCSVVDPLYHMTFNLSSLTRNTDYTVSTGGEWDFKLNICGKLKSGKNACKDSGSCQISHVQPESKMHDAGKANTTLTYNDGVVTLSYLHGEKCHKKYERSTVFRFTCHHSENLKPTFINESADCTYLFDWPTPKACPPINIVECIAQDQNGVQYDLSSLSLTNNNHVVSTRGETSGAYYVNVCRSLLHKPGVTCPPNSAVCFRTADKKFYNLGQVHTSPRFEEGKLILTYTNGDVCLSNKNKNYTTTVHFQCDTTAAIDSSPVLTSDLDACDVQLLWITKAACAIPKQERISGCTAINPRSKHEFNLTSLAVDDFHEIRTEDGRIFHINICKPVIDSNCPAQSSVCVSQGGSSYSGGQTSSDLSYSEGALSLSYQNGKQCHAHPQYKYSTVISFVCHRSPSSVLKLPHAVASKPVFVSDDADTCTHYFSWHTHLACEVQTPCSVAKYSKNNVPHIIDLSSLISESGHYAALSDVSGKKAAYYINVCRPLEPIPHLNCPPGSAVCEITSGHVAKSLGYIDPMENFLSYDSNTNTVVLQYKSNRTCETNISATVSTKIIFSCLPGSTAVTAAPMFTTVTHDCVYVFEWGTELLCSKNESSSSPSQCSFHDTAAGLTYDLSPIKPITVKYGSGTFMLNPCSDGFQDVSACEDSPVCFRSASNEASSLGKASTRQLLTGATYKAPVIMTLTNGSQCPRSPGKLQQASIIFRCDQQNSLTVPSNKLTIYYNKKDPCEYTVIWPTPHVCPMPSESCVAIDSLTGVTYDLALLSSLTRSWKFADKQGNKYFINVCRRIPSRDSLTSSCHENATVCRITKDGTAQSFGILRSQEIETKVGKVIIRYRGGDRKVCSDPDVSASTEIQFECDKSITGAPQFKELSSNDCKLTIIWKTRAACPDLPETVKPDKNWSVVDPKSGNRINLAPLMDKTWISSGDSRKDKNGISFYNYAINLRGQLDLSELSSTAKSVCTGNTAVCQYKPNQNFARKIAEASSTYVMTDDSLEINFTSSDRCGKNKNKTSHIFIILRCSQYSNLGQPTFMYESNECGYFFQWYTNVMCQEEKQQVLSSASPTRNSSHVIASNKEIHEVSDRHNNTATVVIGIMCGLFVFVLLAFGLRNPRGRMTLKRIGRRVLCCAGSREPSYRFIRSEDLSDDEVTSLFDDGGIVREETSLLKSTSRNRSSNPFETEHVDILPIGGASAVGSGSEDDLFDIPSVKISSQGKKQKSNRGSNSGRKQKSSSNATKSNNLLNFDDSSSSNRAPGVGGEKTSSYHDDDDVDMLDA